MKRTLVAAALIGLALTGCGKEEPKPASAPVPSAMPPAAPPAAPAPAPAPAAEAAKADQPPADAAKK
jgi:2-oxoglutarate dehydrogenase E2 component (dihydrolipoamide succinyltransferase)